MKYTAINELNNFDFHDSEIRAINLSNNHMTWEVEEIHALPNNTQNHFSKAMCIDHAVMIFQDVQIESIIYEGYETNYEAINPVPASPSEYENILRKAASKAYYFIYSMKNLHALDTGRFSVCFNIDDNIEEGFGYALTLTFSKSIVQWDGFCGKTWYEDEKWKKLQRGFIYTAINELECFDFHHTIINDIYFSDEQMIWKVSQVQIPTNPKRDPYARTTYVIDDAWIIFQNVLIKKIYRPRAKLLDSTNEVTKVKKRVYKIKEYYDDFKKWYEIYWVDDLAKISANKYKIKLEITARDLTPPGIRKLEMEFSRSVVQFDRLSSKTWSEDGNYRFEEIEVDEE